VKPAFWRATVGPAKTQVLSTQLSHGVEIILEGLASARVSLMRVIPVRTRFHAVFLASIWWLCPLSTPRVHRWRMGQWRPDHRYGYSYSTGAYKLKQQERAAALSDFYLLHSYLLRITRVPSQDATSAVIPGRVLVRSSVHV
jgi:hypothetical protein